MPDRIRFFQLGAIVLILAGLVTLLAACDSITGPEPPDRSPFLTGTVFGVNLDTYPGTTTAVEKPNLWFLEQGSRAECANRVWFVHDPEILFRISGSRYLSIDLSELEAGLFMEVWVRPGEGIVDVCPSSIAPSHIVVSAPR